MNWLIEGPFFIVNFRVDLLCFVEHKDMFEKENDRQLKIKRSESAYPPIRLCIAPSAQLRKIHTNTEMI